MNTDAIKKEPPALERRQSLIDESAQKVNEVLGGGGIKLNQVNSIQELAVPNETGGAAIMSNS